MSLMSFPSAHFIFFTNLAFPNFYKTICTNIDLPACFLEISGSGEKLTDFFHIEIINFWIVRKVVTNSVYPYDLPWEVYVISSTFMQNTLVKQY